MQHATNTCKNIHTKTRQNSYQLPVITCFREFHTKRRAADENLQMYELTQKLPKQEMVITYTQTVGQNSCGYATAAICKLLANNALFNITKSWTT